MKRLFMILSLVFIILTLVGAFYVFTSNGTLNVGFAIMPMVFALACLNAYHYYNK